ncbi:MAG: type III PLP-dependent enzyme [Burkholderiales bacterium]
MLDITTPIYETRDEVPLPFDTVRAAVRHNHHRTPFLLLDLELIRNKIRRFREAMPRVRIHYAVKANPHADVLKVMLEENASFEVASLGELEELLSLGAAAAEVHYNNPIKPREHIEAAARAGVGWFVVDCLDELHKIMAVKPDARLCMRIETQNIGSDWPLTGKFGASLPEASALVREAVKLRADLAGVSFHVGSQCRNLENWRIGVENAKLAFELMRRSGLAPRLLNIGGGYPVRHTRPIPSIEAIGATVNAAIADLPAGIRVMSEPGRYLISDCAWLVSRVIGTAVRHGTRWVYLDTGIFHGLMEALEGLEYEIRSERRGAAIPCTVAGPTCDSVDVVARDRMLPADLAAGDFVYVPNAGAYTTAYATSFNGFPPPDTVVLQHVEARAD